MCKWYVFLLISNWVQHLSWAIGNIAARHQHCDCVAVQQDLIQFRDASAFWRVFVLGHILQQHVHKVIEAEQRSDDLLVVPQNDVNSRSDAFVHELCDLVLLGMETNGLHFGGEINKYTKNLPRGSNVDWLTGPDIWDMLLRWFNDSGSLA